MLESVDVGRSSVSDYEPTAGPEVVERLRALAGPLRGARILHLNTTPYGGVGVDATMRFTPTGGLAMGTRSGDLGPGVLLYLLRSQKIKDGPGCA
jgi:hypothetical protein